MGACEHSDEQGCALPPTTMAGGSDRLIGEAAAVQFVSDSKCGLGIHNGLSTLEVGDGNAVLSFSEQAEGRLDTGSECELADGPGAVMSDCLGERLEELVVEPLLSLDISSGVSFVGVGPAVLPSPEQDCSFDLDSSLKDRYPGAASAERSCEETNERPDIIGGPSDGNMDSRNVNGIERGLSRICFDESHGSSERESHSTNFGEYQVLSGRLGSGYTQLHVPDSKEGREQSITESLVDDVSNIHAGLVGDSSAKSLIKTDALKLELIGPVSSVGHAESSNCEDDRIGTAKTEDAIVLNRLDTSLSLRRSSRSRKTIQQLPRCKSVFKSSKKNCKLALSRTADLFSKVTKKKRSRISRLICASGWGSSAKLSKYFVQSLDVNANQVLNASKSQRKAGQRSRNRNTIQLVASSSVSLGRQEVPCRPIRLKVTFGKKEEQNKVNDTVLVGVDTLKGVQPGGGNHDCGFVWHSKGGFETVSEREMDDAGAKGMLASTEVGGRTLDNFSMSGKSCPGGSSLPGSENLGSSCAGKVLDPGTSPDSEVIDQFIDSSVRTSVLLHSSVNNVSGSISSITTLSCPASAKSNKSNRNKKDKLCQEGNAGMESGDSPVKDKESIKDEPRQKNIDIFCSDPTNYPTNAATENPLSNSSSSELVSMELPVALKAPSVGNCAASNISSGMVGNESAESGNSNLLLPTAEIPRKKKSKSPKSKGTNGNKSRVINAKKNLEEPFVKRKGDKKKLASTCKSGKAGILDKELQDRGPLGTGNQAFHRAEADCLRALVPHGPSCIPPPPSGMSEPTLLPRVAWVCCDECNKWRCIPAELADMIEETNSEWTCKDNQDLAFADCSIPQEKSDADINAELEISDEEDGRGRRITSKDSGVRVSTDPQHAMWMLIKTNLFLHRSRKTQTMDEIMVCHCKPPGDGTLGCGTQCLNRMLNIECVRGTCPCGDLCSNQSFQRCQYAKLSWFRSGRKGYGLQVLEDISEGQFLIEYVGEVLDLQSYEARQTEYASMGHKHFYFMTLNGNEVIDACAKGNLGRFVNHSCDPNCRTEKWVVNGEICVGLFTMRKIRKGEELTFDYNYVRVFGAAAKKCHCGSLKCRGYIGGDPVNAEVIVHGDSDDEFPEPVVVDENGKIDHSLDIMIVKSSAQDVQNMVEGDEVLVDHCEAVLEVNEAITRVGESFVETCGPSLDLTEKDAVIEVCESSDGLATVAVDSVMNEPLADALELTSTPDNFTSTSTSSKSDVSPVKRTDSKYHANSSVSSGKLSDIEMEGERPPSKARPRMKISRPSKSFKNLKSHGSTTSDEKTVLTTLTQKSKVPPYKIKKLHEGSANGHHEGVEEKLNELLDSEGGICKKKDASRGYLKLLHLTAASGDSGNGWSIQSNRELSMILDAILKTKSRAVLLDIINKNGLQMLHNMMKDYRKDFKKTPILRKLLKALEFLAEKEILSVEHIVVDPLCPGVESFRESIFILAEHEDKKVHQTARNFRDRWIPRSMRKYYVLDGNDQREFSRDLNCSSFFGQYHHGREQEMRLPDFVECMKQAVTTNNPGDTMLLDSSSQQITDVQSVITRPRKRRSRWDQPADPVSSRQNKEQRIEHCSPHRNNASLMVVVGGGETEAVESRKKAKDCHGPDDVMQDSEDDVPPGFPCLQNSDEGPPGFSSLAAAPNSSLMESPSVVSTGILQERFSPHLSVAYGIPFSVLQQLGTPGVGTTYGWAVAPAIPFLPFPPLPPYPRDKRPHLKHSTSDFVMTNRSREEVNQNNHVHSDNHRGAGMTSTSSTYVPHFQKSGMINQNRPHHGRGSWSGQGRRHHQQKNLRPPWFRNIDGRVCKGSHPRNRVFDRSVGTVVNEQNGQHLADDYHSVECAGNSCRDL